jgi:UDP-2,3-diacylglucosamine pyrophosphatase LpxH
MKLARQVYVISDLHLGGEYGAGAHPEDRGFRLCSQVPTLTAFVEALAGRPGDTQRTELIINGDFVDFLAERSTAGASAATWTPFRANPRAAAATLKTIVERDRRFFRALTTFLERGHRLVVLLGNHDLELALPFVRRTLLDELQIGGRHDFEFIYDGEAYIVGDGIIEHGNQYDAWNRVNHSSLRKLRAQQSRHSPDARIGEFIAPPGSRLVSEVINPIKSSYRFVDLLNRKPRRSFHCSWRSNPDIAGMSRNLRHCPCRVWRHRCGRQSPATLRRTSRPRRAPTETSQPGRVFIRRDCTGGRNQMFCAYCWKE